MKKKYPVIAFLLGALPLLQAGSGALAFWGPEQYTQIDIGFFGLVFTPDGIACLLLAALGFSWGWGYVYLGHRVRAIAAFFSGAVINFSIFILYLGALGYMDRYDWKKYDDFAKVFFAVVLSLSFWPELCCR